MNDPKAQITRVYERHGCLFVEGVVESPRGWLKSAFTVPQREISHMDRVAFESFAIRQLPLTTEDKKYSPTGGVLSSD
jgi:hypothetical protein